MKFYNIERMPISNFTLYEILIKSTHFVGHLPRITLHNFESLKQ